MADRNGKNMPEPNFIILYVKDAAASAAFYGELLGRPPAESSPAFALFPLECGLKFGLWSRNDVAPTVGHSGDQAEICFPVADAAAVKAVHADWNKRGLRFAQQPTEMNFGHTFVALDPDAIGCACLRRRNRDPANWVAVASAEHVRRGRTSGFMQVCHGKAAPLRRVHSNDRVTYYSPTTSFGGHHRLQAFTAIGIVEDGDPCQVDMGNGFRPFRCNVRWFEADEAPIAHCYWPCLSSRPTDAGALDCASDCLRSATTTSKWSRRQWAQP